MSRVDPAAIAGPIERWFEAARRELPWRSPGRASRRDPYVTLVSELMLQQTQAARVAERLPGFLDRFPSIEALARADEDDVLAAWSGLGYYRRARLLHAAAKAVIDEHDGSMPPDHAALLSIPGIGPYTAGAIASMAFDRPEPAVDGNVMRVLMRVLGLAGRADGRANIARVRELANAVAAAASSPGDAAEGLIELGAVVCSPRSPDCARCPLAEACAAHRDGRQHQVPEPKRRAPKRDLFITGVLCRDGSGRTLVSARARSGLWAGMLEPPTIESADRHATPAELEALKGVRSVRPQHGLEFEHLTTHRRVLFRLHQGAGEATGDVSWMTTEQIEAGALSTPHRRILLDSVLP